jgi:hypothetical protein
MNLRSREAWTIARHPKTGEPVKDVIASSCGRFTICESWADKRKVYVAWRGKTGPTTSPDLVGGYWSPDEARDACQRWAEAKG